LCYTGCPEQEKEAVSFPMHILLFLVCFWRFGCVRFHPSCHFQYIELHRIRDADDLMLEGTTEAVGRADLPLLIMPRLHQVHKHERLGNQLDAEF
jgi:hypothetical protein